VTFEEWYSKVADVMGIDKDPDHPEHYYDYKAAYEAGEPIPKKGEHMTSKYKSPLHPNRFVHGEEVNKPDIALWDSLNEREASMQEAVKANYDREKMLEGYGF
tara:strand:- start:1773 stop:2081 length:309 start_codon:yes stop_codon:yes gene_type:complete